jgi:hypothetical protein
MAKSVRRRKKQRFYWAEIGFLILGLIALRPSLVADLAAMTRPPSTPEYRAVYDRGYSYPSMDLRYDDPRYIVPSVPSHHVAYWPQYDARTASLPATQHSNAWGTTYQLNTPAPTSLSTTNPTASGVAWPNAQVHQLVHNGVSTPHVASPPWPISAPNPSYYPYPSTAPGSTGRY